MKMWQRKAGRGYQMWIVYDNRLGLRLNWQRTRLLRLEYRRVRVRLLAMPGQHSDSGLLVHYGTKPGGFL